MAGGGGGEGEWQQYFDFSYITGSMKKCLFKKTAFWAIFSIRMFKVS